MSKEEIITQIGEIEQMMEHIPYGKPEISGEELRKEGRNQIRQLIISYLEKEYGQA